MEGKERDYAWYLYKGIPVVIVGTYSNGNYDCEKFDGLKSLDVTARVSSFSIGDMSDIAIATNESVLEIADIEKKGIEITSSDVHQSYNDSFSGKDSNFGSPIICKSVPDFKYKNEYIDAFITKAFYEEIIKNESQKEKKDRITNDITSELDKAYRLGCHELTNGVFLMLGETVLAETKGKKLSEHDKYLSNKKYRTYLHPKTLFLKTDEGYIEIPDPEEKTIEKYIK